MIPKHRKPTHPGEILLEEFLEPMELSQVELAHWMGVPVQRVNTLINGKRDMTAETAILLSRVLKTTPEFWMSLQDAHDLFEAQEHLTHATHS
jgi:addiction module HigA family antidote